MNRHTALAGLALPILILLVPLPTSAQPVVARDYYSLQVASSKDAVAIEKLYTHYSSLPFTRIEKRGTLYVLRAGFWDDQASAQRAVADAKVEATLIRLAVFRPEAILKRNWTDKAARS